MLEEVYFDRFYIEKEDLEKYKEIENDKEFALKNHPELFFLSACMGYRHGKREQLIKREQLTLKSSVLNLHNGSVIYDAFKYIALENNEVDNDGKLKVNAIIEEYAKGGFKKLHDDIIKMPSKKNESLITRILCDIN